jgi:hypothetical protein
MRRPIRELIGSILAVSFVLAALIEISVAVGHHQPDSPWIAALRLNECELPCWNGIVPGETTLTDARTQVEAMYGDTAIYLVEVIYDMPNIFALQVAGMGYGVILSVITGSSNTISEQDPVQAILMFPYVEAESNFSRMKLSDLYGALGDVEGITFPYGENVQTAILFYKANRVSVTAPALSCQQVLLNQEIEGIDLHDTTSLEESWVLREMQPWQGFGRCYET